MNYYRRFPGDYLRDTQHLTIRQHGVYSLLLDFQYSQEKPIVSIREANHICRSGNITSELRSDQRAVRFILEHFFVLTEEGYWNNRVREEIAYVNKRSDSARASAQVRHERDRNATETRQEHDIQTSEPRQQIDNKYSVFNESTMRTHSGRSAIPDYRYQKPQNSKEESTPLARESALPGFELFWQAYPRKVKKPIARRAWLSKVRVDDNWPDVLKGLELWKSCPKWETEPEFIPYPATFLNGMQWQDSPGAQNGKRLNKAEQREQANIEAVAESLRRRRSGVGLAGQDIPQLPK